MPTQPRRGVSAEQLGAGLGQRPRGAGVCLSCCCRIIIDNIVVEEEEEDKKKKYANITMKDKAKKE